MPDILPSKLPRPNLLKKQAYLGAPLFDWGTQPLPGEHQSGTG